MSGVNIVGVQFRRAGKLYDFLSGDLDLRVGEYVVVDTERGSSLGKVAKIHFELKSALGDRELKSVLRRASERELAKKPRISQEEVDKFTKDKINSLDLKMKILKSEIQFGGNKIIIYFTAPGRVDFRELVKELAAGLKTRVELKQVGARDETKLLGGLGICGREYCCSSFLREFVPVSIKMAKNQNLALNPSKVSGGCGRLLCCLTYEDETYTAIRQTLPSRGTRLKLIERGDTGKVIRADILNQMLQVETEDGQVISVLLKDVEVIGAKQPKKKEAKEEWGDDIDLSLLTEEPKGDKKGQPQKGKNKEKSKSRNYKGKNGNNRHKNNKPKPAVSKKSPADK